MAILRKATSKKVRLAAAGLVVAVALWLQGHPTTQPAHAPGQATITVVADGGDPSPTGGH